jgi:DNA-binding PadR family transcriptional regulator
MERELLLLGLLRQNKVHGYKLTEYIERNMTSCTDLKRSTAYFLLDKMVQKGWITATDEQEGNRPPKQVFSITPEGETVFQTMLRENLSAYSSVKFGDDIGIAFTDALPPAEVVELLHKRRDMLESELRVAREIPPHDRQIQLVIDHYIFHLDSELRWLDHLLAQFAQSQGEK